MGVILGDVLVRSRTRYRLLALSRLSPAKECCQQIIGFNDESFSVAVRTDAKKKSVLGKMLLEKVYARFIR